MKRLMILAAAFMILVTACGCQEDRCGELNEAAQEACSVPELLPGWKQVPDPETVQRCEGAFNAWQRCMTSDRCKGAFDAWVNCEEGPGDGCADELLALYDCTE